MFSRYLPIIPILASFLLFWGCSHDHRVHIQPELHVRQSPVGQNLPVALIMKDRRSRNAIYEKDAGPKTAFIGSLNKVNIYPQTSVVDPIQEQVEKGLSARGYNPVHPTQKSARSLQVEILHLRMITNFEQPQLKIPEKSVRLRTAIGVIAKKPGKKIKRLYQTNLDKSQKLLTGEFRNEQFINNGISLTLQKMFEDPRLWQFLAPEPLSN